MSGKRLSRASVLIGVRGLVIKRSGRKRMQHRVIAPTLNNHQRGLGLLVRKLIVQLVKSLLRGHRLMVPPTSPESRLQSQSFGITCWLRLMLTAVELGFAGTSAQGMTPNSHAIRLRPPNRRPSASRLTLKLGSRLPCGSDGDLPVFRLRGNSRPVIKDAFCSSFDISLFRPSLNILENWNQLGAKGALGRSSNKANKKLVQVWIISCPAVPGHHRKVVTFPCKSDTSKSREVLLLIGYFAKAEFNVL